MAVRSKLPTHTAAEIREVLAGLPSATGYRVTGKPLPSRPAPPLPAFTYSEAPAIVPQLPDPFPPLPLMPAPAPVPIQTPSEPVSLPHTAVNHCKPTYSRITSQISDMRLSANRSRASGG